MIQVYKNPIAQQFQMDFCMIAKEQSKPRASFSWNVFRKPI